MAVTALYTMMRSKLWQLVTGCVDSPIYLPIHIMYLQDDRTVELVCCCSPSSHTPSNRHKTGLLFWWPFTRECNPNRTVEMNTGGETEDHNVRWGVSPYKHCVLINALKNYFFSCRLIYPAIEGREQCAYVRGYAGVAPHSQTLYLSTGRERSSIGQRKFCITSLMHTAYCSCRFFQPASTSPHILMHELGCGKSLEWWRHTEQNIGAQGQHRSCDIATPSPTIDSQIACGRHFLNTTTHCAMLP